MSKEQSFYFIPPNPVKCEVVCCRACLVTGRLYNMQQYGLLESYRLIVGEQANINDGLPQLLCPMCTAILLKCVTFRERCHRAMNKLKYATQQNLILADYIRITHPQTSHPYKKTSTFTMDYSIGINLNISNDIIENKNVYTTTLENDINDIKSLKEEQNDEFLADDSQIKIENNLDDITEDTHTEQYLFIETSEESNSETLKKVKKKKSKTKLKPDHKSKLNDNKSSNKVIENGNDVRRDRIKGKYFETKENMSNFEQMFEVDIKILSKEQQLKDVLDRKHSYNYMNSPFICNECYKGFIDEDNLNKHIKAQHDLSRGNIICEFCRFRYKDKRGLNQHLKSHRLKFVCRQCQYVSRTTFNAKEHFKMHSGRLHKCNDCSKSYEKLSTYLTHLRLRHPAARVWCDVCGEPYVGASGLNGHKKRAHRDLKFPPDCKCARCGTHFTNPDALDRHARVSADTLCNTVGAACVHCGAGFDSRLMLKDHLLTEHRTVKKYNCMKCDKCFGRQSLYTTHYRRMHGLPGVPSEAKPWVCEVCGKTMPNKSLLVYHQRIHTGEKPYQCSECPKSFTMRKLLQSHIRVHSSERPFACKYCPKTFKGPSALRGHQHVHTGNKTKDRSRRNII